MSSCNSWVINPQKKITEDTHIHTFKLFSNRSKMHQTLIWNYLSHWYISCHWSVIVLSLRISLLELIKMLRNLIIMHSLSKLLSRWIISLSGCSCWRCCCSCCCCCNLLISKRIKAIFVVKTRETVSTLRTYKGLRRLKLKWLFPSVCCVNLPRNKRII